MADIENQRTRHFDDPYHDEHKYNPNDGDMDGDDSNDNRHNVKKPQEDETQRNKSNMPRTELERERRKPMWQPFIAGIDPEVQMQAHQYEYDVNHNPIYLNKPVSHSTSLCVNFGISYLSLFAAFLWISSACAIAFSAWATHVVATPISISILMISLAVNAFSIFLAFRGMCFKVGNITSIILLSFLIVAQVIVAIYFSAFPNSLIDYATRHDRTILDKEIVDSAEGSARKNIGTYFKDNLLLLRGLTWFAVLGQLVAFIYLIFTYHQLKRRQYYIKDVTVQ